MLDDLSAAYTPEFGGALALKAGVWLRVVATYQSVAYTLFSGPIQWVRHVGGWAKRAELLCVGRIGVQVQVPVSVYEDVGTGEMIEELLRLGDLRAALYDSSSGLAYGRVGVSGLCSVGGCVVGQPQHSVIAVGQTTLPYFGGTYAEASLWTMVRDLVMSEAGYLYEDGEGQIIFKDRWWSQQNYTVQQTINGDKLVARQYDYGVQANRVRVTCAPRREASLLWVQQDRWRIAVGETLIRQIRMRATDGRVLAVQSVTQIAGATGCTVQVQPQQNGALVVVQSVSATVVESLTIAGTAIQQLDEQEVVVEADGLPVHGPRELALSMPDADADLCESVARYTVGLFGLSRGLVKQVRTIDPDVGLPLEILRLVTITNIETSHESDYRVIRVDHKWRGGVLETTASFTPYSDNIYGLVGVTGRCEVGQVLVGF